MSTKVSFVIIVYNGEDYAEQCARSVFEQSMEDIEIVFVNDASTDNTEAVIRRTLEEYPNRQKPAHGDKLFFTKIRKNVIFVTELITP